MHETQYRQGFRGLLVGLVGLVGFSGNNPVGRI